MKAKSSILLVEGKDDEHVFYNLAECHQLPRNFSVKNKEGFTNIRDTLDVELDASGLERIGIVVDADLSLESRWESLCSLLLKAGYTDISKKPVSEGTIIRQEGLPIVGVWIMPDNVQNGMLEDFIGLLIPQGDSLWEYAEECLQQVESDSQRFPPRQHFSAYHRSKARIHTWLAWQEDPGKPMGQAITKKFLDAQAPYAQRLVDWLRILFPA